MSLFASTGPVVAGDSTAQARAQLMQALDMGSLWQACASLVAQALPCHSCSLMFDIDDYEPQQSRHFLTVQQDSPPVTSLAVSAPYLAAHPQVRWYTFSQIASQDKRAVARLRAQAPAPGWREFVHLAFWNGTRLDAVLSIRIRGERQQLSEQEQAFLGELYPMLDSGLRRVRTLESERIRHRAFEALLYRLPLATAVVDDRLAPLYASQESRRIFNRWAAASDSPKRLPSQIELAIRQAIRESRPDNEDGITVQLAHRSQGNGLQVEISPPLELASGRHHYILTFVPQQDRNDGPRDADARRLVLLGQLSPSERKVAALVAQGLRNDEVAEQLHRSRKTIESQISSIYRKLQISNRTQLTRLLA